MLETSHRLALTHMPDASRAAAVRPPNLQKTMGAMVGMGTADHYRLRLCCCHCGFPPAPENFY
jgi:hypothetical protein